MLRPGPALRVFKRRAPEETAALDKGTIVISVFDYGAGNLRSVQNTLGAIGAMELLLSKMGAKNKLGAGTAAALEVFAQA